MSAYPPCSECDGTGWILYRAETVDGELEEAYRLCPKYCAPRYSMSKSNGLTCPRPGTVRYGLRRYFCKEHIEVVCIVAYSGSHDKPQRWNWLTRIRPEKGSYNHVHRVREQPESR